MDFCTPDPPIFTTVTAVLMYTFHNILLTKWKLTLVYGWSVQMYIFISIWINQKCLINLVLVYNFNWILVGQNHRRKIIMKPGSSVLDPPLMSQWRLVGSEHGGAVIYQVLLVKFVGQVSVVIKVLRSKHREGYLDIILYIEVKVSCKVSFLQVVNI